MSDLPLIISVDDHVIEPATVWSDRLPSKYHGISPRIVRAPVKEMTFIGGKFTAIPGEPGDPGEPVDWWFYEDLRRPLTRLDTAIGVPRDEVSLTGITYDDMLPGSYLVPERLAGHGRQPRRGVALLPDVPSLLRPDVLRGHRS